MLEFNSKKCTCLYAKILKYFHSVSRDGWKENFENFPRLMNICRYNSSVTYSQYLHFFQADVPVLGRRGTSIQTQTLPSCKWLLQWVLGLGRRGWRHGGQVRETVLSCAVCFTWHPCMSHQIHKDELNGVLVDKLWFSAFCSRKWLFSVLMIVLIIV